MTTADFTADELATLARFDATPAAPESWGGGLREELAEVLVEHRKVKGALCSCGWRDMTVPLSVTWEQYTADAALAVFAAHLGQQQEAVLAVADQLESQAADAEHLAEQHRQAGNLAQAGVFAGKKVAKRDAASRIRAAALGADL